MISACLVWGLPECSSDLVGMKHFVVGIDCQIVRHQIVRMLFQPPDCQISECCSSLQDVELQDIRMLFQPPGCQISECCIRSQGCHTGSRERRASPIPRAMQQQFASSIFSQHVGSQESMWTTHSLFPSLATAHTQSSNSNNDNLQAPP